MRLRGESTETYQGNVRLVVAKHLLHFHIKDRRGRFSVNDILRIIHVDAFAFFAGDQRLAAKQLEVKKIRQLDN